MKKVIHTNPLYIDENLLKSLVNSGPAFCYEITIKSGLKFKYVANSKDHAIELFIKEQRKSDEAHAQANNYKVRELDYKGMIVGVEKIK